VCHALRRWHRLGISVKGNSATALLDCEEQDTKEISRKKAQLSTDGIILYGQEIDDEAFFDVSTYIFIKWFKLIFNLILPHQRPIEFTGIFLFLLQVKRENYRVIK
jgi:hypothetical protein